MANSPALKDVLQAAVDAAGLEFWGFDLCGQDGSRILRVYIENEDGVSVDHCTLASEQISVSLDVIEPPLISGRYHLEVSSPGMERGLFSLSQYSRYIGQKLNIKLHPQAQAGIRRRYVGVLSAIEGDDVVLNTEEGEDVRLSFTDIETAHLKLDWSKQKPKQKMKNKEPAKEQSKEQTEEQNKELNKEMGKNNGETEK